MQSEHSSSSYASSSRGSRRLRRWLVAAALASSHPFGVASAESDRPTYLGDHTLNGHTFVSPILLPSAFVTTHFGIRQGVQIVRVPRVIAGDGVTVSGLQQVFDFGGHLGDAIGFYATGGGDVTIGTDAPSLIFIESSFSVNAEAGLVLRLARLDSGTQISLRAGAGAGTGRGVDVQGLLGAVFSDNERSVNQVLNGKGAAYVFKPQSSTTFAASLLAAQSLSSNFGLQASVEGRRNSATESPLDPATGTRVDNTSKETELSAGVAFSADGAPSGVPVGVVLEYKLDASRTDGGDGWDDPKHVVALGLYYTGRRSLQLGVGGITLLGLKPLPAVDENFNPTKSGKPSAYAGQFIIRYVW